MVGLVSVVLMVMIEELHENCQAFFVCLITDLFCAVLLRCEMKQQGCPVSLFISVRAL